MKIGDPSDKRLVQLIRANDGDSVKGLKPQDAKKIRRQIAAIEAAATPKQIASMPGWKVHELTPGYPGKWAMTVTGNYRLTFQFVGGEAHDLAFEDYH
ncbi:type II toxin-antitoxin system RelE/ParE family toxin [Brevundimonas sp. SL130]|uniref:type II toxin-antitoxin system RelE/ParE family toxin n=1 Tax=Brevundimonas sp. SL130 TaxID=2995143 RepID=UPI00226C841A|nr:type II toxin-antitoxin system RelE/ParE family toxin [Brevundimonas sp. SL130]WAC61473.1 type II toxin-antitoxin system RelE/ParE family toxin [Brevundimonas sp. SL130]